MPLLHLPYCWGLLRGSVWFLLLLQVGCCGSWRLVIQATLREGVRGNLQTKSIREETLKRPNREDSLVLFFFLKKTFCEQLFFRQDHLAFEIIFLLGKYIISQALFKKNVRISYARGRDYGCSSFHIFQPRE